MHKQLIDLCASNASFFESDSSKNGQCLYGLFMQMKEHVTFSEPLFEEIHSIAPQFDFDPDVPANGYRSALAVANIAMSHAIKLNEKIEIKRKSLLFPKRKLKTELEVLTQMMKYVSTTMLVLVSLVKRSEKELIFAECQSLDEFFSLCDMDDLTCFFGQYLGFQYCCSMRALLKRVSIGMAAYNAVYHSKLNKVVRNVHWIWSGGKYVFFPKVRAQTIFNITQYTSIDFCKSFWTLTETDLSRKMVSMVSPKVAVNQLISIPAEEFEHVRADGCRVQVPLPKSHSGHAPVQARLLSAVRREGMDGAGSAAPRSRSLLFHCHGGGFVAQTSRSHEVYLKDWAKQLDMPVLSIDYSLAPSAPYPRAIEEVLYSYVWALANASRLGTTAEYVIFTGDSAGANLVLSLALKCIELGITPPVGLMLAYVPVLISPAPSPARFLSITDPIVPFGFLLNCLVAYSGPRDCNKTNDVLMNGTHHSEGSVNNMASTDQRRISENNCAGFESDAHVHIVVAPVESSSSTETNVEHVKSSANVALKYEIKPNENNQSQHKHPFFNFITGQNMNDPKDPYMSPYWASSEALSQLPPVSIVTVEFDPCLDDCVWFAKRLKSLGNNITLDVLSGLPHGFLNFAMFCKEAHDGSDLCVTRIKELFEVGQEVEG